MSSGPFGNTFGGGVSSTMANTATGQSIASMIDQKARAPRMTKKIFEGRIEVHQASNGYIIHIGSREGYEYDAFIAATIKDVNEIIATQIVAFRLEDK